MKLKYAGLKPLISHKGISFDESKEDKFIYLNTVVELIKALDHEYINNKVYVYDIKKEDLLDADEILNVLKKYYPDIDKLADKTNHSIEEEIEENIKRAHENSTLDDIEKDVLINNIELMHDYMLQRSVNKSIYYAAMRILADIVQKDHIDHIIMPMHQHHFHVLHSLQGTLVEEKSPVDTKLEIYEDSGSLFVKLQVISLLKQ